MPHDSDTGLRGLEIPEDEGWKDRELMLELYEERGFTYAEMGDILGCTDGTISSWMKRHKAEEIRASLNIEITEQSSYTDAGLMETLYVDEELSTTEIAAVLDCSTGAVMEWLDRHGIDTRSPGEGQSLVKGGKSVLFYTDVTKGYERFKYHDEHILHHQLLAIAYHGFETVCQNHVHHKNGIRWDNRPDNIEPIPENEHYKLHDIQKMTWLDHLRAAEMYRSGASSYDIAPSFDVSAGTIIRAVREVDESLIRGPGGAA